MAIRIPIITTFDKRGVDKALSNINGLSRQAGKAAGVLAGGVAVGIGASVREFAKFDEALNQSLAIMGDITDTMRGEMSDAAREVAKTTTFSAEQAAESFFFLASAGLDAEQSVAALPQVASFAQAGMFDMATATDLATDAQSALGLASDDAQENLDNLTRVTDVFVKANTLANTTVEQLASALTQKAGNALKSVGKDIEEGSATLAVFADQGIKGERAGTLLTNTLFGLTENAEKNAEGFEKLGIQVFDASGNVRNMADIAADVTTAFDGMSQEQKLAEISALGFTKQTREGVLALAGNSEKLREYETELRNAGGTAQEVADKQLDTFNAKLALLGSAVTDVGLDIGEKMAPKIEELIGVVERLLPKIGDQLIEILDQIDFEQVFEGISKFLNFIADNIQYLDELIVGLAAFAVGLKAFTVSITIARTAAAAFGATLTVALGPIGLISAALGALGVVIGANALANQDARTEQEKFNDEIVETAQRIEELKTAQEKNNPATQQHARQIEQLEEKLRELRAAQQEANNFTKEAEAASYAARDASIANRLASQDLIPALDGTRDGMNELAFAAQNAELGVTNLTIAEEAQRLMEEQSKLPDHLATYKSYEEILAEVTAKTRFQTEEQVAFNESVKETARELGLVVPGMDDASTSTTNYSTATSGAASATAELSEEVVILNGVMADGQKANSDFLDLMHGIEETDVGPSVGEATRQVQSMITELAKADELIRQEGGLFEFMQDGANVTAEFDEAGNLISATTDPGVTPLRTSEGENFDLGGVLDVAGSELGSQLTEIVGGTQGVVDALTGQTSLINKETGVSRSVAGDFALEKALEEGFEIQEPKGGYTSSELFDAVKNIGDEIGVDVALGKGGIVMKPTKALIGEAGPEAVVPLDRAGSFGKTTNNININVNAGAGTDPVSVGRAVVDAIKRYESTNGRVFAKA